MNQTGKQELDEALANSEALQKQLDGWERRLQVQGRVHLVLAMLFLTGTVAALWFLFEHPAKAAEAAGAAIAFAIIGIVQVILASSSRRQGRAAQICKEALNAKRNNPT
jgi:TRAP-type uncharacterized transport system fused permease subunit